MDPMRLLSTPSRLYRVLAFAEMVTWTLLIVGMLLKYVLDVTDVLVRIGGGLHGFTFLCYLVVTVLVAIDQRWRLRDVVLGIGSAVIPFMTVPFERSAMRRGLLGDSWRLRAEPGRNGLREGRLPRAAPPDPGRADRDRRGSDRVLRAAVAGPAHAVVLLTLSSRF